MTLAILKNKWFWIVIAVIVVALLIYHFGKAAGSGHADYPDGGAGIPQGWTPTAAANELYNAIYGAGTDEQAIWNALNGLTKDQLAAIYNEYTATFKTDLFADFRGDLSGDDLVRAMNYFNGISF